MNRVGDEPKSIRLNEDAVPASYGFVPGLNGLRAVSIMLVLIGHYMLPRKLEGVSAMGVFLFFAISGFLITRLLFAEKKRDGRVDIPGFFFRRYLRLYPVIIVYVLVISSIFMATGQRVVPLELTSVFLYFTNYLETYLMLHGEALAMPIGHLWSLAVEEHFYLIMPFAFLFMRGDARRVAKFALLFTIAPLLIRYLYVTLWPGIIGGEIVYRPSETRFDSIAIGVLLAAMCELPKGRAIIRSLASPAGFVAGLALLLLAFAYKGDVFGDTLRYTIRNVGCILVLIAIVFGRGLSIVQHMANWPIADWIGRISYSLYIWQGSLKLLFFYFGLEAFAFHGIGHLALAFLLASISFYCIEKPALRLKNLRKPPPTAPIEARAAAA